MPTALLLSLALGLVGCRDVTAPPAIRVSVSESRVVPALELIGGEDWAIYRQHITLDVDVSNTSSESVWLSGCTSADSAPAMLLEREDGRPSPLQARLVCQAAPSFEVPAHSTVRFAYARTADIFCSANSDCEMAEPTTWGYHRLVVSTETGAAYSNRFAISSPLIFD